VNIQAFWKQVLLHLLLESRAQASARESIPDAIHENDYKLMSHIEQKRTNIKHKTIITIFLAPLVYGLSYVLLDWYVAGDQYHYTKYYQGVTGLSFLEAYLFGRSALGASEPLSLFIIWAGSSLGIEKKVYIAAFNSLLGVSIFRLIVNAGNNWIFAILVVFGFYSLVLMTGAERLKFGYLFFVLAFSSRSVKLRLFFIILGVFSHFQMILLIPSIVIVFYYRSIKSFFVDYSLKLRTLVLLPVVVVFFAFFLYVFFDALYSKFTFYFDEGVAISDFTKIFALTLVALLSTKNWKRMLFTLFPFWIAVSILGGDRVNMLVFSFVLFLLVSERRLGQPTFLIVLVYFLFKSWIFVENIYFYGNGFPSV
jgi:hypothetical protein